MCRDNTPLYLRETQQKILPERFVSQIANAVISDEQICHSRTIPFFRSPAYAPHVIPSLPRSSSKHALSRDAGLRPARSAIVQFSERSVCEARGAEQPHFVERVNPWIATVPLSSSLPSPPLFPPLSPPLQFPPSSLLQQ